MLASSLFVCLILITPAFTQQARYYFSENFGQIFHDYTQNQNPAVNGDSNLTTSHDTIPLDRGAYFSDHNSSLSSYISFPQNEIVSKGFSTYSGLYVSFWVLFIESPSQPNQGSSILNRFDTNTNLLIQLNKTAETNQLVVRIRTIEFDITRKSSSFYSANNGIYYTDVWNYILLGVDGIKVEVYLSNVPVIAFELPSTYKESVSPLFILGHPSASFKGIVFESLIFTTKAAIGDLFGGEYFPGNCLLHNCPKSCFPSYLSENTLFCLPVSINTQVDSEGNLCEKMRGPGPNYGCYKSINLECNCRSKSCVIENNQTKCWCSRKRDCNCPMQMYFNSVQCVTCNTDCLSCEKSSICSDCIAENAEPNSREGCTCKDGFFNSSSLNHKSACLKCKDECKTCKFADSCELCKDLNAEFIQEGCKCKAGFFADKSGVCEPCDAECGLCEKGGECLTCKDSNALAKNGRCICSDRYYNITDINSEGTCLFCNLDCVSCDLLGECTACTSKNSVKSGNKGCQCEEGFYNISSLYTTNSCLKCSNNCKSCSQELSCDTCLALNASPYLFGCICDQGFYNNSQLSSQDSCKPCHSDCQTCDSADRCLICKDRNASPNSSKGCACSPGFSNTTSLSFDGACKMCDSACDKCDSNFECLSCKSDNSEILNTKNGCKCIEAFYNDTQLITRDSCKSCLRECKSCKDPNGCETCKANNAIPTKNGCKCEDQYFNTTSLDTPFACLKCHPHCSTCESSSQCLSCISQNAVLSASGCICQEGFYNTTDLTESQSCIKCQEDCQTCNSSSTCLACKDKNSILSSEGCTCLPGFYLSSFENSKKCLPCNIECKTCDSNTTCLACKAEHSEVTKLGCKCLTGFYNSSLLSDKDSCKPCHTECYNCTLADKCSRCKVKNAYSEDVGCKCFNGYFNTSRLDESGNCMKCNEDCAECSNNETCTKCWTQFARPSQVGCECIDGFHNVSALTHENSCIDIDLYSISIEVNNTKPTALFWFSVVVVLQNKDGLPMQTPTNVTLISYSDDLYPAENLTKLSTNGTLEFEVFCKNSGGNSLGVQIGPVSNSSNFVVSPQVLKIHSIEPEVIIN